MGPKRTRHGFSRVEAGMRLSPLWLGGIQRSDHRLRAWHGLADAYPLRGELRRLDFHLSMGELARPRRVVFRSVVHTHVFSCMDRLSRHSRLIHARKAQRLFRK